MRTWHYDELHNQNDSQEVWASDSRAMGVNALAKTMNSPVGFALISGGQRQASSKQQFMIRTFRLALRQVLAVLTTLALNLQSPLYNTLQKIKFCLHKDSLCSIVFVPYASNTWCIRSSSTKESCELLSPTAHHLTTLSSTNFAATSPGQQLHEVCPDRKSVV